MAFRELAGVLNQLAGVSATAALEAQGAANKWAGNTGAPLETVGALNFKARGASLLSATAPSLEMDGVCNLLAGTSKLNAVEALNVLAGNTLP
jgi:hypothetical protein